MRNTQIQQQRNQHESSQKLNTHTQTHTSWPKRTGNILLIKREASPKMGGERTRVLSAVAVAVSVRSKVSRRFPVRVQVIACYYNVG